MDQFGQFDLKNAFGPSGYVSATTIGVALGIALPGIGIIIGAAIGAAIDVALSASEKKKERRKLKKAFYEALLKRYNTQIFISALERMGPAMVYLQDLGLKPGTEAYDQALTKKLKMEIGYTGNCGIDLYGPAPPNQPRPLIASIDHTGEIKAYSPHIDLNLGPKWAEACKEFHKAALQAWAEEQAENMLYLRDVEQEKNESTRNSITRVLVNAGIILVLIGYSVRQKKKLKYIRRFKAQKRAEKKKEDIK